MPHLRVTFLVLAVLLLLPAGAGSTSSLVHDRPVHLLTTASRGTASSLNWSGYAAKAPGTTFTDVKGTWAQPAASCPSPKKQYSSFWVGLDGYNSSSVEQIGTSADCVGRNRPSYYAWYEMYPAYPVKLNMVVHPGDVLAAEVGASGSIFTLSIQNVTTGASFSIQQTSTTAATSSAEWVAEAPSSCTIFNCSVLPLANFGTVNFSGSYTTGNGHVGSISDAMWTNDQVVMVTNSGAVKALPSPLSTEGTAFSVTWKRS